MSSPNITAMHPALAHLMAMHAQQQERPLTDEERAALDEVAYWDAQAIVIERMSATLDLDHGTSVRNNLTDDEINTFVSLWNEDVLDVCLRAGLTTWEVRRALRTHELPGKDITSFLAEWRNPDSP